LRHFLIGQRKAVYQTLTARNYQSLFISCGL
jgi:hypothetical protein